MEQIGQPPQSNELHKKKNLGEWRLCQLVGIRKFPHRLIGEIDRISELLKPLMQNPRPVHHIRTLG